MFREIILPIFRSTRLCVTACGVMHRWCCRPSAGNIIGNVDNRGCVEGSEGQILMGRPGRRWEYNIKMDLQEMLRGQWLIDLTCYRARWWAIINLVINLGVPQKARNFMTCWELVSFPTNTPLRRIPLSCTGCLAASNPQTPATLAVCPFLHKDCFTLCLMKRKKSFLTFWLTAAVSFGGTTKHRCRLAHVHDL